jgi:hypothetical protein
MELGILADSSNECGSIREVSKYGLVGVASIDSDHQPPAFRVVEVVHLVTKLLDLIASAGREVLLPALLAIGFLGFLIRGGLGFRSGRAMTPSHGHAAGR